MVIELDCASMRDGSCLSLLGRSRLEARPCQIIEFFNGTKQMLVPLFQRPYEWKTGHWEALWEDVSEQYERTEDDAVATHFTGAIVTAPARSIPVGVSKHLVIDGQQRLTTVAILLCAMRSLREPNTPKYRKITRLLINEDDEDFDHFKLLPTQPDREAFQALVAERPVPGTRFAAAFEFFKKKLGGKDSDGEPIDLDRFETAIYSRLTVVSIHLGEADDPYLIFESLNAKGATLTQADLIRNYLLLRLHTSAQQKLYEEAWLPMQALLPGEHLTEFMRQFLMMTGEDVAKSSIYAVLKKRLFDVPDAEVEYEIRRMQRMSMLYAQVIELKSSGNPSIDRGIRRLRRWGITTANPFILALLEDQSKGLISPEDVISCLSIIESYAVRRTICGVPTNQLKRILLAATRDRPKSDVPAWLSQTFARGTGGRQWPKDDDFKEAIFRYRAYEQLTDRCKFILESIEECHGHKEPAAFEKATIEHVMPRTLTSEWRAMLGNGAEGIHERWLDLLSNLTLTGYNSELSNAPFEEKRKLLADSNFAMNRWIAERPKWTEEELRERSVLIFERARKIWPRPDEK